MGTNKQCITRLQKEYKSLLKEPVPHVTAHPSSSLLEWHFVLEGNQDFEGGVYHGKVVFPPQYPFKPPSISLFTPNGRFATNTKLCLSMTDYHPESWNPMWSVGTILTGLLSFMHDSQPTTGSIVSTKAEKAKFAQDSLAYNMKNPNFRKLFPDWVEKHELRLQSQEQQQQQQQQKQAPEAAAQEATEVVDNKNAPNGGLVRGAAPPVTEGAEASKQDVAPPAGQSSSRFLTIVIVVAILSVVVLPWVSSSWFTPRPLGGD